MYELPLSQYDVARPFFPQGTAGRSFVAAHLEHNHTGRIYVDNLEAPEVILVALTCEFFYIAGNADCVGAHQALYDLLTRDLVDQDGYLLLFPASPAWQSVLEEIFRDAPELHHAGRAEFHFDLDSYTDRQSNWRERLPAGCEIQRYDHALSEDTELAEFWGSLDAFLERGFGYAVTGNNGVISRCHAVMIGDGEAEISISTTEAYRRQGFATMAACAFIDHCIAHNLTPAWSCWDNNAPSRALAESLGFIHRGDTPALVIKVA